MESTTPIDTLLHVDAVNTIKSRHPLVNVYHGRSGSNHFDAYTNKGAYCLDLICYENQVNTLSFSFPDQPQARKIDSNASLHRLIFHPELIQGTSLVNTMDQWSFLRYAGNVYLNLTAQDTALMTDCLNNIALELNQDFDKHSERLLICHIERLLVTFFRIYDRQPSEPAKNTSAILQQFDQLLNQYLSSGRIYEIGFPTVAYFADQLHHSRNYFGDLVKKQTGKSAQHYIRRRLVNEAKSRISDMNKSINDIAYELGFKYPQHFCRFFKSMVCKTPNEYRQSLTAL